MATPSIKPNDLAPGKDVPTTGVRRRETQFVAQAELDRWVRDRRVIADGALVVFVSSGEPFVIQDAVRILGPMGRTTDEFGMTGRVMTVSELLALGGVISSSAVRIGTASYEVQLGCVMLRLEVAV